MTSAHRSSAGSIGSGITGTSKKNQLKNDAHKLEFQIQISVVVDATRKPSSKNGNI